MKITRPFGIRNLMLGYGRMLKGIASAACTVCLIAECQGQGTMTFTFEGQPRGTVSQGMGFYDESGMRFSVIAPGGIYLSGGGIPGYPDDGTGYLEVPDASPNGGGGGLSFNFNPNLSLFNLVSFDAAPYDGAAPPTLEVVGYKIQIMEPTITVTNYFTATSGNFQTLQLSSSFQNVYEVEILGDPFSLDNVVISGVPEPSCGALAVLAALCGLGRALMRSRRTE
jgi:hypothetical protein